MEAGGRFTTVATNGIVGSAMSELRRAIGLGQREFAALLSIPLETYRPLDSGRRAVSVAVLQRARKAVAHHQRQHERLPLSQLAKELHVHIRTLQAAVRTGRLDAHLSVKSVFGRPRRLATRAAAEQFMATHYRRFSGQEVCPDPLPRRLPLSVRSWSSLRAPLAPSRTTSCRAFCLRSSVRLNLFNRPSGCRSSSMSTTLATPRLKKLN